MTTKELLAPIAWPALLSATLLLTYLGFRTSLDKEAIILGGYSFLAFSIFVFESYMPHEKSWQANDGQVTNDLLHTVLGAATPEFLATSIVTLLFSGLAVTLAASFPYSLWPKTWFLPAQIFLALLVADFGLYWAHRLGHELGFFWRFHALHHSPARLCFINTGRFHFVDSFKSTLFGLPLLVILSPPEEVILWYVAFYNYVGILSHCNVEMRLGAFNYIFNTPGVHRWHHSKVLSESNNNYGEILMLWDIIFGTHLIPDRRPPADIGIDYTVPRGFFAQLAFPFTLKKTNG
jgi:ornithine lipid hydroxylase